MSNIAIQVDGLEKTYQTFRKESGFSGAVKSFFHREVIPVHAVATTSFLIQKGEFVGLLGPNGAGKTTMLKMMTGLIPPSRGRCMAFETFDTSKRPKDYLRRIGMVMGQRNQLHADLPAIDSFKLSQAIYAISDAKFKNRLDECLDLFDIREKLNVPVRKLSLGERMKMELILAILHEPELLFLDEPTIGLDFNAAKQIRGFLAQANQKFKITTILTSHYTKDIEELCRRVILINHGSVIYDGPLNGLDDRIQGERQFIISTQDESAAKKLTDWITSDSSLTLMPDEMSDATTVAFAAASKQVSAINKHIYSLVSPDRIRDITIGERALEEVFAEVYRRSSTKVNSEP